jgi:hypothetical protein
MTNQEIIEKIKRISDIVLRAQESVTWAQSEACVEAIASELEKLELRLRLEDGSTPERTLGKNIFLESYDMDLETELDDVWKNMAITRNMIQGLIDAEKQ